MSVKKNDRRMLGVVKASINVRLTAPEVTFIFMYFIVILISPFQMSPKYYETLAFQKMLIWCPENILDTLFFLLLQYPREVILTVKAGSKQNMARFSVPHMLLQKYPSCYLNFLVILVTKNWVSCALGCRPQQESVRGTQQSDWFTSVA